MTVEWQWECPYPFAWIGGEHHNKSFPHHESVTKKELWGCVSGICTMCGRKILDTSKYRMSMK